MDDAASQLQGETADGTMNALRFTLWAAERADLLAAGADAGDVPVCPVDVIELPEALALAALIVVGRRALAAQLGISDPAGQAAFARDQLARELEIVEMAAIGAGVEAEFRADPQQDG